MKPKLYRPPSLEHIHGWLIPLMVACVTIGIMLGILFPDFDRSQFRRFNSRRPARSLPVRSSRMARRKTA